jgi:hypothetical protein
MRFLVVATLKRGVLPAPELLDMAGTMQAWASLMVELQVEGRAAAVVTRKIEREEQWRVQRMMRLATGRSAR